jgi:hypothetical protein
MLMGSVLYTVLHRCANLDAMPPTTKSAGIGKRDAIQRARISHFITQYDWGYAFRFETNCYLWPNVTACADGTFAQPWQQGWVPTARWLQKNTF